MENPTQRQAGVAGCGLGWIRTHSHRRSPVGGQGCGTGGRTVVESSGKCRMRTTALNAHPPCAEDTGRAGARAPGVRVLCRNPYSRSQRTPCPAPPPAQRPAARGGRPRGPPHPPGSSSSRGRGPPPRNRDRPPRAAGHPIFTVGSTSARRRGTSGRWAPSSTTRSGAAARAARGGRRRGTSCTEIEGWGCVRL